MKTYHKYLSTIGIASTLFACTPKADVPTVQKGTLDVSKYVAIGNSITSGYADNALYYAGQEVSYPNLLSKQFAMIGGGSFTQPLVAANSVGIGSTGGSRLVLGIVNGALSPVPLATTGDQSIFTTSVSSQGPFNNMGVPGAKAITTVYPGYGNPANGVGKYNPFFYRMTTSPATASILSDAAAQKPTFFSLFIGNNDVLAYALAGGASDAITPSAGAVGVGFNASVEAIVATMMASGAKQGVVANIPDIASLPFFTTVPYNPLTATIIGGGNATTGATNIAALNTGLYGPLVQVLTALGQGSRISLLSATTANPLLIKDISLTDLSLQITAALTPSLGVTTATVFGQIYGQVRQATADDYILLSTSSVIGTTVSGAPASINVNGISYPLADQYVLTKTEAASIKTATSAYNTELKNVATTNGLAFVDVNAFMAKTKTGFEYNGRFLSTTFVTGGAFSLDGIHLTPIGNALLANEFIQSINATYGSSIPQVDASTYSGVVFP